MIIRSLRFRLLVGAGIAIFVALAVAWGVMTLLFARHLERRAEEELRRNALQLVAGVTQGQSGLAVGTPPTDPRFGLPGSGLYWQVSVGNQAVRSRSLWDQQLERGHHSHPTPDGWTFGSAGGPFERHVYVLERLVTIGAGRPPVLVQVAEDGVSVHIARAEFSEELTVFLVLLWCVLAAGAWVQVSLGLRPLGRLRAEVLGLKHRPDARLSDSHSAEIAPLVAAINGLADARQSDVQRARQRAADLAHGLKTPLAALTAQTRLLSENGAGSTEGMERALASARATLEAELGRARAALGRYAEPGVLSAPAAVVGRLATVLERTEKGMRTDIDNAVPPDLRLSVDEADLTEILGALLENAVKFARREVRIEGGEGMIAISDDGPGMEPDVAERAMARGVRVDERGAGHGLGLAIAVELTEATGGRLTLGRADQGGLLATLRWDRNTSAPP